MSSLIVIGGNSFKKGKTHWSSIIWKTDRDLSGQTKWPWWWAVKQGWCVEDSLVNPKRSSVNHLHASTSSWEQSSQLSARYQWVLRQFSFNCWDEIVWEISDKESLNKDKRPCLKSVLKMCYLQNRIWCEINAHGFNSQKWFWQAEMTSLRVGWHPGITPRYLSREGSAFSSLCFQHLKNSNEALIGFWIIDANGF